MKKDYSKDFCPICNSKLDHMISKNDDEDSGFCEEEYVCFNKERVKTFTST